MTKVQHNVISKYAPSVKICGALPFIPFNFIKNSPRKMIKPYLQREAVKNVLADFSVKGVPPPTPLTENHFAKKTLVERGGTPPPPLTDNSQKKF